MSINLTTIRAKYQQMRKFAVASAGVLGEVVALGVLPEPLSKYATTALAVLTALGVYAARNEPKPGLPVNPTPSIAPPTS